MRNSIGALAFAAVAAVGCGKSFPEHRGLEGNAMFGATRSRGCVPAINLFGAARAAGCALDRPFATGVRETIAVVVDGDGEDDALEFRALDGSLLRVDSVSRDNASRGGARYDVDVIAQSPGVTELRAVRADGSLVDRVRVEVANATRITLAADTDVEAPGVLSADGGEFRLRVAQRASITAVGVDARGRGMFSNDAVYWSVPDTRVVSLSWGFLKGPMIQDDRVYVTGESAGRVTMRATVNGVGRDVDAVVAP